MIKHIFDKKQFNRNKTEVEYNQDAQNNTVYYSYVIYNPIKDTFEELFPKVKCRDYLSDAITFSDPIFEHEDDLRIYGFNFWNLPVNEVYYLRVVKVGKRNVLRNLELVFENMPVLSESEFFLFKDEEGNIIKNDILIKLPQDIRQTPILMNIVTLLIRLVTRSDELTFSAIKEKILGRSTSVDHSMYKTFRTEFKSFSWIFNNYHSFINVDDPLDRYFGGAITKIRKLTSRDLDKYHEASGLLSLTKIPKFLRGDPYTWTTTFDDGTPIGVSWVEKMNKIIDNEDYSNAL